MPRSLEIFGDRWPLLVLRDIIFAGARQFRELLAGPDRLNALTEAADPSHEQKVTYSRAEQAIQLVPAFTQLSQHPTALFSHPVSGEPGAGVHVGVVSTG